MGNTDGAHNIPSSTHNICNRLLLLSYAPAGHPVRPVGVLFFDARTQILWWRLPEQWSFVSDDFDREYLSRLSADIAMKVDDMGGRELLAYLEDTLSNLLRLSELAPMPATDPDECLRAAYDRYVAAGAH
jgi:hypothetical protein